MNPFLFSNNRNESISQLTSSDIPKFCHSAWALAVLSIERALCATSSSILLLSSSPTTIYAQSNADAKAKQTDSKKAPPVEAETAAMLRPMRWMSDGDRRWNLDAETLVTMEGTARPVPGDPLPFGLSRGPRVTRPKQLDFFHRFMASLLVPSFSASGEGLFVHHTHLLHLAHNW
jgi:hypothetical protein